MQLFEKDHSSNPFYKNFAVHAAVISLLGHANSLSGSMFPLNKKLVEVGHMGIKGGSSLVNPLVDEVID